MSEQDDKPAQEHDGEATPSVEDGDVRDAIELTRQALEASAAEIERSKRLLRETEEFVSPPNPFPGHAKDGRGSS